MRFLLVITFLISSVTWANNTPVQLKADPVWDQGLDRALEKLQKAIEKRPDQSDQLLTSFWRELKTKVWSESHRVTALELSKKLNLNLQFPEPGSSPLATNQIQKLAKELGPAGQNLEVLANGLSASEQDLEAEQSHWVGLLPNHHPVIFWGSWKDFQNELRTQIPVAKAVHLQELLPEKTYLQEKKWPVSSPKSITPTQRNLILLGLVGAIAYSLKDKKVVIRR